MRRRPKALGSTLLLTLLATLHVASSTDAASVARQCRQACHDAIAACVTAGGRFRACRKTTLGRCKGEGLAVCQGQANANGDRATDVANRRHWRRTTTTKPVTTTTATRPPITTSTIRPPVTTSTTVSPTTTSTTSSSTTTSTRPPPPTVTGLHYAPNCNFETSGNYMPGKVGTMTQTA